MNPAPCLQPLVGISVIERAVIRNLLGPNLSSGRSFRQVMQYAALHFSSHLKQGESIDLIHGGVNSDHRSAARP